MLVVHQTRVDAQGRIAMTRLGADLRPVWSVTLPYTELRNRWQLSDRLVLFGSHPDPQADDFMHQETLAVLGLQDGVVRAWNLTLGRDMPVAAK